MGLVDSHCHLDFDALASDADGVIARAHAAGVETMVTICTKVNEFDKIRPFADKYDRVFCTIGLHPNNVDEHPDVTLDELVRVGEGRTVVGIGETGLDYYYDHADRERQKASFRTHIAAARALGLPVIVHSRDAEDDTARILEEEMGKGAFPGVLHCFSSDRRLADAALALGFYVSFAGIVTFKNAEDLRATARAVPLDRILVETDAPYLAPVPMRGKSNEPAFVVHTAAKIAELRNLPVNEIADVTSDNFYRLFSKVARPAAGGAAVAASEAKG